MLVTGALRAGGVAGLLAMAAAVLVGCGSASTSTAPAGSCTNPAGFHDPNATIGVAYGFLGNSWRATMKADLERVANQAVACHQVANVIYTTAGSSDSEQIANVDDLILKHVNVILLDAVSTSGECGAIEKAQAAGIPVINFDTPVSCHPPAYTLNWQYQPFGQQIANFIAQSIHGQGNVLYVRGVAGTVIDNDTFAGVDQAMKGYPSIHVVGTVYANWDEPTAQEKVSALLPSLPPVAAVVVNGGDYGVIQAFQAAHRPIPVVVGDNRGTFLQWWWGHRNTYKTFSASTFPGCSAVAFYAAQYYLKGSRFPSFVSLPFLTITASNLAQYNDTPVSLVADLQVSPQWVEQHVIKAS